MGFVSMRLTKKPMTSEMLKVLPRNAVSALVSRASEPKTHMRRVPISLPSEVVMARLTASTGSVGALDASACAPESALEYAGASEVSVEPESAGITELSSVDVPAASEAAEPPETEASSVEPAGSLWAFSSRRISAATEAAGQVSS